MIQNTKKPIATNSKVSAIKANKGEWAEFYAHLKILADRKIAKGNERLEPVDGLAYPVLAIFKQINPTICRIFDLSDSDNFTITEENSTNSVSFSSEFIKPKIATIFEKILIGSKREKGAFGIAEAIELANQIQLPIKNKKRVKADIILLIEDFNTDTQQKSKFSIKSKISANASLLNASKSTRLAFEITGLELNHEILEQVKVINLIDTIPKVRDRIQMITKIGGIFEVQGVKSNLFQANLKYFDSQFETIIGNMLILAYLGKKNIKEIVESESFKTTLQKLEITKEQSIEKVKDFLLAFALEMEPKKPYTSIDDLNGGILWVKKDGSLVCHHVFDRKELKQYLYENTFFESPSTGRHDYGYIYKLNGKLFLDLCIQIRFK